MAISPNDTILSLDGTPLQSLPPDHLARLIMGAPGSSCELVVQHPNGLEERVHSPAEDAGETAAIPGAIPEAISGAREAGEERVRRVGLGLVFKEPDGRPGREVVEVKSGSAGEEGLLEKGDRVISIDGTPIANLSNQ
ncbi:hypothetical protein T484DRAFT_1785536, partial [Baffinella frigidus]